MTTTHTRPVDLVLATLAAVDRGDIEEFLSFVADDVHHRFGNEPVVNDKTAFVAAASDVLSSMAGISHDVGEILEVDAGVVMAVMEVTYTRHDGRRVTLPCSNLFRVRDGLITDYRVYVDLAPVTDP